MTHQKTAKNQLVSSSLHWAVDVIEVITFVAQHRSRRNQKMFAVFDVSLNNGP